MSESTNLCRVIVEGKVCGKPIYQGVSKWMWLHEDSEIDDKSHEAEPERRVSGERRWLAGPWFPNGEQRNNTRDRRKAGKLILGRDPGDSLPKELKSRKIKADRRA